MQITDRNEEEDKKRKDTFEDQRNRRRNIGRNRSTLKLRVCSVNKSGREVFVGEKACGENLINGN